MANLNDFKAELRSKVIDYAVSYQLVMGGEIRTSKQREEFNEKLYEKLEKFILEEFNTWIIDNPVKVEIGPKENPEDTTLELDF